MNKNKILMNYNSLFHKYEMITFCLIWMIGISFPLTTSAQNIDWPNFIATNDLVWTEGIDSNFYHGAFIGDGIQGAMILQDNKNENGLRMLLGHYKAITHNPIAGLEFCDSRVYVGNIIITPVGKTSTQTMRLDIWDGEANGVIITDKGKINWRAFVERKLGVFVVSMKGERGEATAKLSVREEWGISPIFYLQKLHIDKYAEYLPPKPILSNSGGIDIVTQKMKKSGAHVVASQKIRGQDKSQILYAAISVNDNADPNVAAKIASDDAVTRVKEVIAEGETAITGSHHEWWHNYMQSSYLELKQDPYWQKFWWLQMYKFACTSSETSDMLIDTQGPWIWETYWAAVVWNLNLQLSYLPMFSSNKLDVGRSLINGMDRIYKSGAFRDNTGESPGITVGRITSNDGKGDWGDEFGNMPWILFNYWKYWSYSGNDTIGRSLFPMLKDNATFLMSKLEKDKEGIYHLSSSRSPEYTEDLYLDANYGLMGLKWTLLTLISMDKELGFNDSRKNLWQETLSHLVEYPSDENGLRISADQGFDVSHRHYSHLLAIYPYHTLSEAQGQVEKDLIKRSVDRWQNLKGSQAGYTYTGGCAMYATMDDGNKALEVLDQLKIKLHPNTMYSEGSGSVGGPVIETPLSAVESINYLLIQSWDDTIRVFPAVPSRWKDISFKDFRTQGAFLVSASLNNSLIGELTIKSEMGKICNLLNPWKNKEARILNDHGLPVKTVKKGEVYSFDTQRGKTYKVIPL